MFDNAGARGKLAGNPGVKVPAHFQGANSISRLATFAGLSIGAQNAAGPTATGFSRTGRDILPLRKYVKPVPVDSDSPVAASAVVQPSFPLRFGGQEGARTMGQPKWVRWGKIAAWSISAAAIGVVVLKAGLVATAIISVGVMGSILLHEVAHLVTLNALGEKTAEEEGSSSLNPVKHLDSVGSILIPFVTLAASITFLKMPVLVGWAKAVKVDFSRLQDPKRDSAMVALSGPVTNVLLAMGFALLAWALPALGLAAAGGTLVYALAMLWKINAALAAFNLLPLPQLDGGKILVGFLPESLYEKWVYNPNVTDGYQTTFRRLYEGPAYLLSTLGLKTRAQVNIVSTGLTALAVIGYFALATTWLRFPMLLLALPCSWDYYCIREKMQSEEATNALMGIMQGFSFALAEAAEEDESVRSEINPEEVEHVAKGVLEDVIDKIVDSKGFDGLSDEEKWEKLKSLYMEDLVKALKVKGMSADDPETIRRLLGGTQELLDRIHQWIDRYEVWKRWKSPKRKESIRDASKMETHLKKRSAGRGGQNSGLSANSRSSPRETSPLSVRLGAVLKRLSRKIFVPANFPAGLGANSGSSSENGGYRLSAVWEKFRPDAGGDLKISVKESDKDRAEQYLRTRTDILRSIEQRGKIRGFVLFSIELNDAVDPGDALISLAGNSVVREITLDVDLWVVVEQKLAQAASDRGTGDNSTGLAVNSRSSSRGNGNVRLSQDELAKFKPTEGADLEISVQRVVEAQVDQYLRLRSDVVRSLGVRKRTHGFVIFGIELADGVDSADALILLARAPHIREILLDTNLMSLVSQKLAQPGSDRGTGDNSTGLAANSRSSSRGNGNAQLTQDELAKFQPIVGVDLELCVRESDKDRADKYLRARADILRSFGQRRGTQGFVIFEIELEEGVDPEEALISLARAPVIREIFLDTNLMSLVDTKLNSTGPARSNRGNAPVNQNGDGQSGTKTQPPRQTMDFSEALDNPALNLSPKEKQALLLLLTEMKLEEKPPIIGRTDEMSQLVKTITSPRGVVSSVVLVGEAGVGKTAVPEKLAQAIAAAEDHPGNETSELKTMAGRFLLELDVGTLLSHDDPVSVLSSLLSILGRINEEDKRTGNKVILFMDEIHLIFQSQHGSRIANLLKKPLRDGNLTLITATTEKDYRKYMETDDAFRRRLIPIYVKEATPEETLRMLQGRKQHDEFLLSVKITEESLQAAAELSQYDQENHLPDKAFKFVVAAARSSDFDVQRDQTRFEIQEVQEQIGHAMHQAVDQITDSSEKVAESSPITIYNLLVGLTEKLVELYRKWMDIPQEGIPTVTDEIVRAEIAKATGVETGQLTLGQESTEKYLTMEESLSQRVMAQEEAIHSVSEAIIRNKAGLSNPDRPMGVFYLTGPTGVGKTYLARELARFLFKDPNALIRLDMSEYMEPHSIARMIGSPPGYVGFDEGGQLTGAVRRRPYSVVLLDEIEKAHQDVWDLLLQIIGEGRLTDGKGRTVDFRNTVFLMTSNLGMHAVDTRPYEKEYQEIKKEEAKYKAESTFDEHKREIEKKKADLARRLAEETKVKTEQITDRAMREVYRPEFTARIDEILVFNRLTPEAIKKIAKLNMDDLASILSRAGHKLTASPEVYGYLAEKGFSIPFGARPLQGVIKKEIVSPIAKEILRMAAATKKFRSEIHLSVENDAIAMKIEPAVEKAPEKRETQEGPAGALFAKVFQMVLNSAANDTALNLTPEILDEVAARIMGEYYHLDGWSGADSSDIAAEAESAPFFKPGESLPISDGSSKVSAGHYNFSAKDKAVRQANKQISQSLDAAGFTARLRNALTRWIASGQGDDDAFLGWLKIFTEHAKKMTPKDEQTTPIEVRWSVDGGGAKILIHRPGEISAGEETLLRRHFAGPVPRNARDSREKAEMLMVQGKTGWRLFFELYRVLSDMPGAGLGYAAGENAQGGKGTDYWVSVPKPQPVLFQSVSEGTEQTIGESPTGRTEAQSKRDQDRRAFKELLLGIISQGDQRSAVLRIEAAEMLGDFSGPEDIDRAREWIRLQDVDNDYAEIMAAIAILRKHNLLAEVESELSDLSVILAAGEGEDLLNPLGESVSQAVYALEKTPVEDVDQAREAIKLEDVVERRSEIMAAVSILKEHNLLRELVPELSRLSAVLTGEADHRLDPLKETLAESAEVLGESSTEEDVGQAREWLSPQRVDRNYVEKHYLEIIAGISILKKHNLLTEVKSELSKLSMAFVTNLEVRHDSDLAPLRESLAEAISVTLEPPEEGDKSAHIRKLKRRYGTEVKKSSWDEENSRRSLNIVLIDALYKALARYGDLSVVEVLGKEDRPKPSHLDEFYELLKREKPSLLDDLVQGKWSPSGFGDSRTWVLGVKYLSEVVALEKAANSGDHFDTTQILKKKTQGEVAPYWVRMVERLSVLEYKTSEIHRWFEMTINGGFGLTSDPRIDSRGTVSFLLNYEGGDKINLLKFMDEKDQAIALESFFRKASFARDVDEGTYYEAVFAWVDLVVRTGMINDLMKPKGSEQGRAEPSKIQKMLTDTDPFVNIAALRALSLHLNSTETEDEGAAAGGQPVADEQSAEEAAKEARRAKMAQDRRTFRELLLGILSQGDQRGSTLRMGAARALGEFYIQQDVKRAREWIKLEDVSNKYAEIMAAISILRKHDPPAKLGPELSRIAKALAGNHGHLLNPLKRMVAEALVETLRPRNSAQTRGLRNKYEAAKSNNSNTSFRDALYEAIARYGESDMQGLLEEDLNVDRTDDFYEFLKRTNPSLLILDKLLEGTWEISGKANESKILLAKRLAEVGALGTVADPSDFSKLTQILKETREAAITPYIADAWARMVRRLNAYEYVRSEVHEWLQKNLGTNQDAQLVLAAVMTAGLVGGEEERGLLERILNIDPSQHTTINNVHEVTQREAALAWATLVVRTGIIRELVEPEKGDQGQEEPSKIQKMLTDANPAMNLAAVEALTLYLRPTGGENLSAEDAQLEDSEKPLTSTQAFYKAGKNFPYSSRHQSGKVLTESVEEIVEAVGKSDALSLNTRVVELARDWAKEMYTLITVNPVSIRGDGPEKITTKIREITLREDQGNKPDMLVVQLILPDLVGANIAFLMTEAIDWSSSQESEWGEYIQRGLESHRRKLLEVLRSLRQVPGAKLGYNKGTIWLKLDSDLRDSVSAASSVSDQAASGADSQDNAQTSSSDHFNRGLNISQFGDHLRVEQMYPGGVGGTGTQVQSRPLGLLSDAEQFRARILEGTLGSIRSALGASRYSEEAKTAAVNFIVAAANFVKGKTSFTPQDSESLAISWQVDPDEVRIKVEKHGSDFGLTGDGSQTLAALYRSAPDLNRQFAAAHARAGGDRSSILVRIPKQGSVSLESAGVSSDWDRHPSRSIPGDSPQPGETNIRLTSNDVRALMTSAGYSEDAIRAAHLFIWRIGGMGNQGDQVHAHWDVNRNNTRILVHDSDSEISREQLELLLANDALLTKIGLSNARVFFHSGTTAHEGGGTSVWIIIPGNSGPSPADS